ncbi:hypothetical protein DAI22_10g011100 [Oryza sativa Japonica Group]|jgi:hypothetical protein|uniref:Expressed protein n=3 Tax=Oryza TaxID=4527 RepID=Q10A65_ORYSJ|nr:expressed protein [Oryza sativa Japonica Group]KAF2912444.1 hypothetical protein DAI22_10g011100 [Oryza sativa Japonica Group]
MMQKKEKKERKKEKRRQKKAAQLGEKYETDDHHSKHGHKKRKHSGCEIVGEETRKVCNVTMEHLEKSSLSEEHEAPSYSQALRCTPESSLDSTKRLRTEVSSSPSQTRNGVNIRVKFTPTNQRRDPEATTGMSMKPRVTEQSPVKETGMDLSMANRKREFQPHVNTVSVVKQVVSQQKNMSIRNGNCLDESRKVSQQHDAKSMQRVNMVQRVRTKSTPIAAMQRVDPPSSEKAVMQRANPAPTKVMQGVEAAPVKSMQRANPTSTKVMQEVEATPVKAMQIAGHITLSKVFNRESTQVQLRKETGGPLLGGQLNTGRPTLLNKPKVCADPPILLSKPEMLCVEPPGLLNKPKAHVEPPVVKQQQQIVPEAQEEPCSVGSVLAAASPVTEAQQSSSDRKSRKAEKKGRKLADLFVNWKPSPTQMEDTDVGDQDWLFSCRATPKNNCRTFDGSARCQPTEQLFSLQPRAVHLPDLLMYQLPFVVPF